MIAALAGCSDVTAPAIPGGAQAVQRTSPRLEGSYETRTPIPLDDGSEVFLVQVHFDRGERADGHTYLAQVATRGTARALSILKQSDYVIRNDSIHFSGSLLAAGPLTETTLDTHVQIEGRRVPVRLHRIP